MTHYHKPYEACNETCPEPHYTKEEAEKLSEHYGYVSDKTHDIEDCPVCRAMRKDTPRR